MKNNRVLSLIGLATKAGKTVSGEFSTEKSVKTGKGLLVIVAEDASETCAAFMKFRFLFIQIKRALAGQWERNSVPAWLSRMKTLRKQS